MEKTRDITEMSDIEHAASKTMWLGAFDRKANVQFVIDHTDRFVEYELSFSDAWHKMVDEILVNCIDHFVNYPKLVTGIWIRFNPDASIEIVNDGPSIPIDKQLTLKGDEVHIPEIIASRFRTGDNLKKNESITGGTNGLGLKLVNVHSRKLVLRTYNAETRVLYEQEFRDGLKEICPPVIRQVAPGETLAFAAAEFASGLRSFTSIYFSPKYKQSFGYPSDSFDPATRPEDQESLQTLFMLARSRAYQVAAATDLPVVFNGERITMPFFKFCSLFYPQPLNEANSVYTVIPQAHPAFDLNWYLVFAKAATPGDARNHSLINGIWVRNGGTHITHLRETIAIQLRAKAAGDKDFKIGGSRKTRASTSKPLSKAAATKASDAAQALSRKLTSTAIFKNLDIFFKANIINPAFDSQTKVQLSTPKSAFKSYQVNSVAIDQIWAIIREDLLMELTFKEESQKKSNSSTSKGTGRVIIKGASDAEYAGNPKYKEQTCCVICEGISAKGTAESGVSHPQVKGMSNKLTGLFPIQGVTINVRKACTMVGGLVRRSDMLKKNEKILELMQFLNLDYSKQYALTPEGDAEFRTLRYGRVVFLMDQDVDGKGHISGLLINFFAFFWPALVQRGFILRYNTPIIRIYSGRNIVADFYNMEHYKQWKDGKEGKKGFKPKYFKGLGGHDDKTEIKPLFEHWNERMITYTWDDHAEDTLDIYYGKSTAQRKHHLVREPDQALVTRLSVSSSVSVSEFCHTDVKEFQRSNICRKIPSPIDGLIPSRRKVLFTAISNLRGGKDKKVYEFVASVTEKTKYHHGDQSLCGTVIRMAQDFPTTNNLPFLIGIGNFGSRRKSGDHGAANERYTAVRLNGPLTRVVFVEDDFDFLELMEEEEAEVEPRWYVPVIPLAVLETFTQPATGWNVNIYARNIYEVIKYVWERVSNPDSPSSIGRLHFWVSHGSKCQLYVDEAGDEVLVGSYSYRKGDSFIYVTEIPTYLTTETYLNSLFKDNSTADISGGKSSSSSSATRTTEPWFTGASWDDSTYVEEENLHRFHLKIELTSAGQTHFSGLQSEDEFIHALKLRGKLSNNLNFIGIENEILELNEYKDVIDYWFGVRKLFYAYRIVRAEVMLKIEIEFTKNILRFIANYDSYGINRSMTRDKLTHLLIANKYHRFDTRLLNNPREVSIRDLEKMHSHIWAAIIDSPTASYDYLINMRVVDTMNDNSIKLEKELAKLEASLRELQQENKETAFLGQKVWLRELQNVVSVLNAGLQKGWHKI